MALNKTYEPLEQALFSWALKHGACKQVAEALAACQKACSEGHSCLDLNKYRATEDAADLLTGWADALAKSDFCSQADGVTRPLILDGQRLYLQRYWDYEQRLVRGLSRLLQTPAQPLDINAILHSGLGFKPAEASVDWQAVAVATAIRQAFCIIAGGPGTGKTHTVLRLLILLIRSASDANRPTPVIRLAAPTGKAAARMMESIAAGLEQLELSDIQQNALPTQAETLHRLLGISSAGRPPTHNEDNPLVADVVIVDEASMIDLPMMTKLVEALPRRCKLVLLGDRYQLASVEAGSVLAELCKLAGDNAFGPQHTQALQALLGDQHAPNRTPSILSDHVATLKHSRRFHAGSAIGRLAAAVNVGDAKHCEQLLSTDQADLRLLENLASASIQTLLENLSEHFSRIQALADPAQALASLRQRGVLTALRRGFRGADYLNQKLRQSLAGMQGADSRSPWFHGHPIMIVRNDYQAGLFNGDLGICLRNAKNELRVWFETSSGLRAFLPSTLPEHNSAYALTVHKSQGSEFDHVDLLLPDQDSSILSRELVYTGITRARHTLDLHTSMQILNLAISRQIDRYSGLADALAKQ